MRQSTHQNRISFLSVILFCSYSKCIPTSELECDIKRSNYFSYAKFYNFGNVFDYFLIFSFLFFIYCQLQLYSKIIIPVKAYIILSIIFLQSMYYVHIYYFSGFGTVKTLHSNVERLFVRFFIQAGLNVLLLITQMQSLLIL